MLLRRIYICFLCFFQVRTYFICKSVEKYCWRFFIFCRHCTWTSACIQAELHIWTRCLRLANLSLCGETLFFKHIFSYINFIYQNFFCKLTWTSKLYDYLLVALLWNTTWAPPAIIYQNFHCNRTWTSQYMFFIFVLACTLHGIHDQHSTWSHNIPGLLQ